MNSRTLLPIVLLLALLLPSGVLMAQVDTLVVHVPPRGEGQPFYVYHTITYANPMCEFGAAIGEVIHYSAAEETSSFLAEDHPPGFRCEPFSERASNLDSLARLAQTEPFTAGPGDSISYFIESWLVTWSDTSKGWYHVQDTVKYFVEVVDAKAGTLLQVLDSVTIEPFDHTSQRYGMKLRHEYDRARQDPAAVPLFFTKALEQQTFDREVRVRLRPYVGRTAPGHVPHMNYSLDYSNTRTSEDIWIVNKRRASQIEDLERRLGAMVQRYMGDIDPKLAKLISIKYQTRMVHDDFDMIFISEEGRTYDITVVNEDDETVHTFDPVYAFPGVEQKVHCSFASQKSGYYLALIKNDGALCKMVPVIVELPGDSLVPSASPIKPEFRSRRCGPARCE